MQSPDVPDDPELAFRVPVHTRWSDEDIQGVLNNAVVPTLLEEARHAFFDGLGLLDETLFPFLLLQSNVRFLRPGRGGVDATVELYTTHLGTKSFTQAYRVRGPQGETWCEAEAVMVCCDLAAGVTRPMPAAFRAALEGPGIGCLRTR